METWPFEILEGSPPRKPSKTRYNPFQRNSNPQTSMETPRKMLTVPGSSPWKPSKKKKTKSIENSVQPEPRVHEKKSRWRPWKIDGKISTKKNQKRTRNGGHTCGPMTELFRYQMMILFFLIEIFNDLISAAAAFDLFFFWFSIGRYGAQSIRAETETTTSTSICG